MAPPRLPSIADSAAAVVTAVRHQRQESLQVLDQNSALTRQWLAVSIEVCCHMLCCAPACVIVAIMLSLFFLIAGRSLVSNRYLPEVDALL
jgi:hypothetical protein